MTLRLKDAQKKISYRQKILIKDEKARMLGNYSLQIQAAMQPLVHHKGTQILHPL